MEENVQGGPGTIGTMHLSDEVVATIAGLAASEVQGIAMSGGLVGGIAEKLGRKDVTRGIKVQVGDQEAAVDLYVIVDYDLVIPDVVRQVQEKVKSTVEEKTGLKVVKVDVHVQGVSRHRPEPEPAPAAAVEEPPSPASE
ncbi:MAG: Asp23/Gls24 family envelope stress response protein [Syntrophomonadaceae bacterium]|jgi:uncharacterized alkaline shock family protein YloU|nr:Asp23/Gls24 family envelope stress response protein [Syntrophomonadaceae bacterium]MDH7497207.1 Asp23/Gls24 family envelope stress response protein [Syntrophomonadaceae bacterium]